VNFDKEGVRVETRKLLLKWPLMVGDYGDDRPVSRLYMQLAYVWS